MIVYHGMPTGLDVGEERKVFLGRHLMVSFATAKDRVERYAELAATLVLDNGAFSSWKRGDVCDPEKYYRFVEEVADLPSFAWALMPDLIDGDEDANDDLWYATPRHLKDVAVPVWHLHESPARLFRLCQESHRVALGSSGAYRTPGSESWWNRITEVWSRIPPRTRIHGLRMCDPAICERLPFSSVDSTTAGRNAHFTEKCHGPMKRCRPETRVRVWAEHLEASAAPLRFTPRPHTPAHFQWFSQEATS